MCNNGKKTAARTQARPVFTRSSSTSLRDCFRKIQGILVGAALDRVIFDSADTTPWCDRRWLRGVTVCDGADKCRCVSSADERATSAADRNNRDREFRAISSQQISLHVAKPLFLDDVIFRRGALAGSSRARGLRQPSNFRFRENHSAKAGRL